MTSRYEKLKLAQGYHHIIGCDEVGRGCLAGPVVAAAVVLDLKGKRQELRDVRDSKILSPKKREELSEIIKQNCVAWGIGMVEHAIIDEVNIHHASLQAMRLALESLTVLIPTGIAKDGGRILVAVDGKFTIPNFHMQQEAVVDGDAKILSIAAASIIAKVFRDDLMRKFDKQYPEFKFAQHKGYATEIHRKAILQHGLSPIHRLSFCGHLV